MTTRRFFALPEQFDGARVELDEAETRHLADVLRLKIGEKVNVFDGAGREFECKIADAGKRSTTLEVISETNPKAPESSLDLTIASVLLKGDKLDLVVQKCVELGVDRFIPMTSARCDVKVGDAAKRANRWRRIAMEATKQCGRAKLMKVDDVTEYSELVKQTNEPSLTRIHFSEQGGQSFNAAAGAGRILAFIGPEGGWDDAEMDLANSAGVVSVTFGGRVMKADTAAVAIASILQHRFGDMN